MIRIIAVTTVALILAGCGAAPRIDDQRRQELRGQVIDYARDRAVDYARDRVRDRVTGSVPGRVIDRIRR